MVSLSPCVVSILLIAKRTKTWRMCFDDTRVDLLDELFCAKVLFKIDQGSNFHNIRIREHDEWKTTLKFRVGLYEWLVLLFGLSNATSSFMRLMTQILKRLLGKYVMMHLDDVLIDMKGRIQHLKHFPCVFQMLQGNQLFINLGMCLLLSDQVVFLVYDVSAIGIHLTNEKENAILD